MPVFPSVHSPQMFLLRSQSWLFGQSAFPRHCTHFCVLRSHLPVGALQSAFDVHPFVHWPSVPPSGTEHEKPLPVSHPLPGVPAGRQPAMHTLPLQMRPDVAPPQSESVLQPQRPVAVTHTGRCVVVHCAAFVPEHCVHAPVSAPAVWQTGFVATWHVSGGGAVPL